MLFVANFKEIETNVSVHEKGKCPPKEGGKQMLNLKLNLKHSGVDQKAIMKYKEKVEEIHEELHKRANN